MFGIVPELLVDDDELLELLDEEELLEEELLEEEELLDEELLDEEDELLAVGPLHPTSAAADVKNKASPSIRKDKLQLFMV